MQTVLTAQRYEILNTMRNKMIKNKVSESEITDNDQRLQYAGFG
ncbi:MAG: hypothetical protein ACJA2G_003251 [Cognaticolwellia sp.]|jgi:hypothetical protein